MDTLLKELHDGIEYLNSQGKQIRKIKMNPKIFGNMTNNLAEVEICNDVVTVYGMIIESDENIEKYAFIMDEVTRKDIIK